MSMHVTVRKKHVLTNLNANMWGECACNHGHICYQLPIPTNLRTTLKKVFWKKMSNYLSHNNQLWWTMIDLISNWKDIIEQLNEYRYCKRRTEKRWYKGSDRCLRQDCKRSRTRISCSPDLGRQILSDQQQTDRCSSSTGGQDQKLLNSSEG